ncbi:SDR family oxidoreductase [Ancylobacter sp. 6x-1]|uniref:SDR family oxidoreductase n=1 Tax=Ancylobacter crimeensis TaxID=2579147 RepID=A0ABT0D9R2_9HYPH|nr:SDR family oxidoreductase [Ancylobacter crimeensis]MCK0196695.1 SDR family oxidoreductase [Ancylobacter crimeensis]
MPPVPPERSASLAPARPVALVTGGAVRIGRAIGLALVTAGYDLAIHARHELPECAALERDVAALGGRTACLYGDLDDPAVVARLVPDAMAALGPVALLVNNASEFRDDAIGTLDLAQWDRHFAVNLRAPVFLAESLATHLPEGMAGAVVNILDQRVLKPVPRHLSYSLTKCALHAATAMMAQALAPRRIRVNAVAPGPTLRNTRQDAGAFARQSASVMLGRGPSPEEIAQAVLFLAAAHSVTGQTLAVDGGQHLAWQTPDATGEE